VGEFMVMAATLLEIKTRMLLPTPPPEEGLPEGLGIDPRAELVRQLLEYKAFKDAAAGLRASAAAQALRFPRQVAFEKDGERQVSLEDVQIWDLLEAFSKVMTAIGQDARGQQVIYDDTPVELHAEDLLDRLRRDGPLTFRQVFEGRTSRGEVVGLFLAMLELVRRKAVLAVQDANFADIHICLNPHPPATAPQGSPPEAGEAGREGPSKPAPSTTESLAPPTVPPAAPQAEPAPSANAGQYVPEHPDPQPPDEGQDQDEHGTAT
jgi:segregation and condensation protein A